MKRLISPLVVLLVWEIIARAGWVNPFLVPAPSTVLVALGNMLWSAELLVNLYVSLKRIIAGFAIAVVVSVLIGILMARITVVELLFDPLVELIRPVSPLAILPLAILWFGIGEASKIFLVALACAFPIILNTYAGVRSIDVNYVRAARSLGASNGEVLRRIVLPGCMPQTFTGIRIAWGIALIVIIAAEMIGGQSGIGYMILDAQQTFRVERVFAGIIAIGVLGVLTDLGFRYVRSHALPWHREVRD
jgi:ABC-type nitrate/sulfonate/bicarbonate transport system permease component